MPTICDCTGLTAPQRMDGQSLYPLMRGESALARNEAWLSEATWQAKRGIRTHEWKYIRSYDPGVYGRVGPELYDLTNDPAEQHNIASLRPDVVGELDRRLLQWVESQLDGRRDPMSEVVDYGLPAVERLRGYMEEDRLAKEQEASADRIRLATANGHVINLAEFRQPRSIEVEVAEGAR
jgi:arylsulfatase A-like enzyme